MSMGSRARARRRGALVLLSAAATAVAVLAPAGAADLARADTSSQARPEARAGARAAATPAATAPKTFLQVGGDPVTVAVDEPGLDQEVLFAAAAGQTVTIDLTGDGFTDPCDVKVALRTPSGTELVPPTCAGAAEGTVLPAVAVTATALLHLSVDLADDARGEVSVRALGTGAEAVTPGAPSRAVHAPAKSRTVLVLPAQKGDTIGVDVRPAAGNGSLWGLAGTLVRGKTSVDGRHTPVRDDRLVWAYEATADSELRLWLMNRSDHPMDLDLAVTSAGERAGVLHPGVPTTVGLRAIGRTTSLTFAGQAGSRPVVDLTATTDADVLQATMTLVTPEGWEADQLWVTRNVREWNLPQLEEDGTYTLLVTAGSDKGRLRMTLRSGTENAVALPLGETATIEFDHPGQVNDLVVDSERGDVLRVAIADFDVSGEDGEVSPVTISGGRPGSSAVQRWGTFDEDVVLDAPAATPGTQQRRLRFTAPADAVGSFTVSVTATPSTPTALTLGKAYKIRIPSPTPHYFAFPVQAGQVPVVTVTDFALEHQPGVPGYLTATGGLVGEAFGRGFGVLTEDGVLRAPTPVTRAGTFWLRVSDLYPSTGTATITVTLVTPPVTALAYGQHVTIDPSAPAAIPGFRLTLTAGDEPYLYFEDAVGWGSGATMDLVRVADGRRVARWQWYGDVGAAPFPHRIPESGQYMLRLVPSSDASAFTMRLDRHTTTAVPAPEDETPVTLATSVARHDATLTVPVPPGTLLRFQAVLGEDSWYASSVLRVVDRAGEQVPVTWTYTDDGAAMLVPGQPAHSGPLTLILGSWRDAELSATVTVLRATPSVRPLVPGQPFRLKVATPVPQIRLALDATEGSSLALATDTFRWLTAKRLTGASVDLVRPNGTVFTHLYPYRGTVTRPDRPLDATGRWTVRISSGAATGLIKLTPYLARATEGELPVGDDVPLAFPSPASMYRYTMSVPSGMATTVAARAATLVNARPEGAPDAAARVSVRLLSADGGEYGTDPIDPAALTTITPTVSADRATTVTLILQPLGLTTGTATIHRYQWGPPTPKALTATPVAASLPEPGHPAVLSFTVTEAGRYGFAFSGLDLDGHGAPGATAEVGSRDAGVGADLTPGYTIPVSGTFYNEAALSPGTYRLTITGVRDTTGTFSVALDRPRTLAANGTASVSLALTRPGDLGRATLSAASTDTLAFAVTRTAGAPPSGRAAEVTVTDAKGREIWCEIESPASSWCEAPRGQAVTMPVTVVVDPQFGDTGTYTVTSAGRDPLVVGWTPGTERTVTVPATAPGQDVDISFQAVKNTRPVLIVSASTLARSQPQEGWDAPPATLQSWDGTQWVDDADVTGPGTYRSSRTSVDAQPAKLRLRLNADAAGSFTARFYLVTDVRGHQTPGTPFTVTLRTPGTWASYPLHVDGGRWVTVTAKGSTLGAYRVCWSYAGCTPTLGKGDAQVTLPQYLRLQHRADLTVQPEGLSTGSVTLTVGATTTPPTP